MAKKAKSYFCNQLTYEEQLNTYTGDVSISIDHLHIFDIGSNIIRFSGGYFL